jgi:glycosyltransferase involved in cell wall biosynthesis
MEPKIEPNLPNRTVPAGSAPPSSAPPGSAGRIAFLLDNMEGGGVQRMTLALAGEFARHGYGSDVLVCRNEGELLPIVPTSVRLLDLGTGSALATCGLAMASGAYIATAVAVDQLLSRRWLRYARCLPPLTRYLATERPACLIAATPRINILAVLATRASRSTTRSIVTERISIGAKLADRPEFRFRRLIPLMKRSYRLASQVVAVSEDLADDVATQLSLSRAQVLAIHNPVIGPEFGAALSEPLDDPWFCPGAPPVVLSAGRSSHQKDFATLLRAFADVRRQQPCRLMILGQQTGRSRQLRSRQLIALSDELGIRDDVRLHGFVLNPFPYMAHAAVFVLSSRYEGLPGVLIQAMACGTPVVSTACPTGPREILEDGRYGRLVPVGDATALGKAILDTLAEPPERQPLIDRARHFSVERAFARYRELAFGSAACGDVRDRAPS